MKSEEMTASERFSAYLQGKPVDRAPVVEWAPWWVQTVERWLRDGLPRESAGYEALQDYFGLDHCIQTHSSALTGQTPRPIAFGHGIMENADDYRTKIKPTLFPDPELILPKGRVDYLKATRERGDTVHFFTVQGSFWFPRQLLGIENHLYSFYDQPELYHELVEDLAVWQEKVLRYAFDRFSFDFVTFEEDMSYNGGPMISEEQFRVFIAPLYERLVPVIRKYRIPIIIDSDGDITKAVDWYGSVGADGMLPLERQAGVDVSVYLKKQPAMAFLGHFDKMCMKYGEKAMRKEFERLLPSMLYGKLIPSVDHQTPPDVSLDTYRVYVSLLKEYASLVKHDGGTILPCPTFAE